MSGSGDLYLFTLGDTGLRCKMETKVSLIIFVTLYYQKIKDFFFKSTAKIHEFLCILTYHRTNRNYTYFSSGLQVESESWK